MAAMCCATSQPRTGGSANSHTGSKQNASGFGRSWSSARSLAAHPTGCGRYPPAPPKQEARLLMQTPDRRRYVHTSQRGSMMQKAAIDYHGGELEAWEYDDLWTVRLGELESSSRYLDLALAELLDDSEGVHTLAARLLAELVTAPEATEAAGLAYA